MHYTRFSLDLSALRNASSPVLEEAQQQWEWIETLVGSNPTSGEVEQAAHSYQQWLDTGEPKRRDLLKKESEYSHLRKAAREEARSRVGQEN